MNDDFNDTVQVVVRMSKHDLDVLNAYVSRSGLSRSEYIRTLCGLVTVLDVNPSSVAKLKAAYSQE